eukprot:1185329-Prorocentrum_minimum.AAC.10
MLSASLSTGMPGWWRKAKAYMLKASNEPNRTGASHQECEPPRPSHAIALSSRPRASTRLARVLVGSAGRSLAKRIADRTRERPNVARRTEFESTSRWRGV